MTPGKGDNRIEAVEVVRRVDNCPNDGGVQMCAGLTVSCLALALAIPATGRAQGDDAQVRSAVRRGVNFLKGKQSADGSWAYLGHELGITALAGLALAENGVSVEEKPIQNALSFV